MWTWLAKAGKVLANVFTTVIKWAYNHPITALLVGLGTYVLTQWVRDRTKDWGYIPVITELGAVASYISSAFQYAIATGTLQRALVNELGGALSRGIKWLINALNGAGNGVAEVMGSVVGGGGGFLPGELHAM